MLAEKDYCDYDTWSALKELGCDIPRRLIPDYFGVLHEPQFEETLHLYDAAKWLRNEKGLLIEVDRLCDGMYLVTVVAMDINTALSVRKSDEYESALLEGIKEAIKILKEKK